ncbi:hypothetical protein [Actinoplanes sp. URMC 104]|uniref:hypothetical protein n=1 Tax=Actinoplanes sp. URMC 104 TaxID=3423409 RepID=UPI003F1B5600
MRQRILLTTASATVLALLGVVTNLITNGWSWWLFAAFLLLLALSVALSLHPAPQPSPGRIPTTNSDYSLAPRGFRGELYGRQDELRDIAQDIADRRKAKRSAPGRIYVLHGTEGVGTSALAYAITSQAAERGVQVWRINGEQLDTFEGGLHDLRHSLRRRVPPGGERRDVENELWDALDAYGEPWLLVIDDVDDLSVLDDRGSAKPSRSRHLLPPTRLPGRLRIPPGNSTIIVTTADGAAEHMPSVETVPVECLANDAGGSLLHAAVSEAGNRREAQELSDALGGHTLSLRLAGAYLRATAGQSGMPMSFRAYRDSLKWDKSWDALVALVMPEGSRRLRDTWERSLKVIEAEYGGARLFLGVLCNISTVEIPVVMLDRKKLARSRLVPRSLPIGEVLGRMAEFGLVSLKGRGAEQLVRIHPVIQQLNRRQRVVRRRATSIRKLVIKLKNFSMAQAPPAVREAVALAIGVDVPKHKRSRPGWVTRVNEFVLGSDDDDTNAGAFGGPWRPVDPGPSPPPAGSGGRAFVLRETTAGERASTGETPDVLAGRPGHPAVSPHPPTTWNPDTDHASAEDQRPELA